MRLITLTAAAAALGVVLTSMPVVPEAEAQTRTRVRHNVDDYPPGVRRTDRRPARITVRRQRSYLDPGTEVQPMTRHYTDYAIPPGGYFPSSVWDVTLDRRHPLPGRFELPYFP